jgi:hypothetical protein
MNRLIAGLVALSTIPVSAAQEMPSFPLGGGPGRIDFVTRFNGFNWYSEIASVSSVVDIIRGEPNDLARLYRVNFLEVDCRAPQRYHVIATSVSVNLERVDEAMVPVAGPWIPAAGPSPGAIRAKQFCLGTDLEQFAK